MSFGFNPRRPETLTLGSLWRAGRTTLLLAGAAFASVAMVDLPEPAGSARGGLAMAQTPVPASGKWIALGSGESSRAKPAAAVDARETPKSAPARQRRKMRGASIASIGSGTGAQADARAL